jgi:protein-S-isoprenylcysteine O-methyltransferase Ste14
VTARMAAPAAGPDPVARPDPAARPGRAARRSFWVAAAFYTLITVEFIYMASPFAGLLYAAYGPGLNLIGDNPVLALCARSFLPHIVVRTRNPLLDLHNVVGAALLGLGLLGFVAGAAQVYHHKLFRRGVVLGGVYRVVRHPQYTCLAISGVGMALLWPRYLVLLSFVTMLFAYWFLARLEERECLARFGDGYRDYLRRTHRFLPFPAPRPVARLAGRLRDGFGRRVRSRAGRAGAVLLGYLLALALALGVATGLDRLALGSLYARYAPTEVYLSVTAVPGSLLDRLSTLAHGRPEVRDALAQAGPDARFISYVLPADWYISETLMAPRAGGGHLVVPAGAPETGRYRIVITRARLRHPVAGRAILAQATARRPVLELVIDLRAGRVVEVDPPYARHPYSGVPVPSY